MDGKSKRTNNPGSERMSAEQDWRYENIRRLQGAAFGFAKYRAPSDEWDHDHCRGCWAKFADLHGPGILHEGYVTALPIEETSEPEFIARCKAEGFYCIPQPAVGDRTLHWFCPQCFEDFRDELGFRLHA